MFWRNSEERQIKYFEKNISNFCPFSNAVKMQKLVPGFELTTLRSRVSTHK